MSDQLGQDPSNPPTDITMSQSDDNMVPDMAALYAYLNARTGSAGPEQGHVLQSHVPQGQGASGLAGLMGLTLSQVQGGAQNQIEANTPVVNEASPVTTSNGRKRALSADVSEVGPESPASSPAKKPAKAGNKSRKAQSPAKSKSPTGNGNDNVPKQPQPMNNQLQPAQLQLVEHRRTLANQLPPVRIVDAHMNPRIMSTQPRQANLQNAGFSSMISQGPRNDNEDGAHRNISRDPCVDFAKILAFRPTDFQIHKMEAMLVEYQYRQVGQKLSAIRGANFQSGAQMPARMPARMPAQMPRSLPRSVSMPITVPAVQQRALIESQSNGVQAMPSSSNWVPPPTKDCPQPLLTAQYQCSNDGNLSGNSSAAQSLIAPVEATQPLVAPVEDAQVEDADTSADDPDDFDWDAEVNFDD